MMILLELFQKIDIVGFLGKYGSEEYSRWSKDLIMSDCEHRKLTREIEGIE